MLGESSSQGLSGSWSELNWSSSDGVVGVVSLVELLQRSAVLESRSELVSLLLVDDSQVSSNSLSDELRLGNVQSLRSEMST